MSNLEHLKSVLKTAQTENAYLIVFFGTFANYKHLENTESIKRATIKDGFFTYPMVTNRGVELWQERYPIEGLYLAINTRSQRKLIDKLEVIYPAITSVMKEADSISFDSDTFIQASRRATKDMPANFTFNDMCTASFLPAGKPLLFTEDGAVYDRAFQQMKVGKSIRLLCNDILGLNANDSQIERITNKVKARFAPIEILISSDVAGVYAMNHAPKYEIGSLNDSCMKNKSEYFSTLSHSSNCRVAYAVNCEGELIARALLWTTETGETILDRIYGTDAIQEKFKTWAINNGYFHRYRQSYTDVDEFVCPNTKQKVFKYFEIHIEALEEDYVPFLDTFYRYGYCAERGGYYLSNEAHEYTDYTCRETNGGWESY